MESTTAQNFAAESGGNFRCQDVREKNTDSVCVSVYVVPRHVSSDSLQLLSAEWVVVTHSLTLNLLAMLIRESSSLLLFCFLSMCDDTLTSSSDTCAPPGASDRSGLLLVLSPASHTHTHMGYQS